jgi:murein DD-endopeptidase MepM/ murein hydrolase activator NlpD
MRRLATVASSNGSAPASAPARQSRASARRSPRGSLDRWRLASAAALAALLSALAAAPFAGAAPAPAIPPRLVIEPTTRTPKQGSIVALAIRSDRPLLGLALTRGADAIPVEIQRGGTLARALVAVDLDAPVGDLPLRVVAVSPEGQSTPIRYALRVESGRFKVQRLTVARGYVEPQAEVIERIKADQAAVAQVWASGDAVRRWTGPFLPPIDGRPADNFGVRRVFNGQPRAPHNGVDFAAPEGTPVVAPAPARVALAGDLYFSGGTIILDHGAGLFTTYFHLSRLDVAPGEVVGAGQPIGAVGSTGRSTGAHLHWGARLQRARVNPLDLLALPDWGQEGVAVEPPLTTSPTLGRP